ncbi:MAG: hypothetical protein KDJ20_04190 [Hyphomicrobiales bacterium]|nr:hypothetical protein [Rhodoblastus sp.]MCC2103286.1 hypothetical protein [Hyphomicrobiales bacterium]MCC2106286.1 hypothetical protein [Hyphomicrobiales bacterium]
MGERGATGTGLAGIALLCGLLSGCSAGAAAPSIPIFGSFFPAWIACALLGVVGAIVCRVIFVKTGVDEFLPARLLVYLALAVLVALGAWRLWYGGAP